MKRKRKCILIILLMLVMALGRMPAMNLSIAVNAEEPSDTSSGSTDKSQEPDLSPSDAEGEAGAKTDSEVPANKLESAGNSKQDESDSAENEETENKMRAGTVLEGKDETEQEASDPDKTTWNEPQESVHDPLSEGEETAAETRLRIARAAPALAAKKSGADDGQRTANNNDVHTHTDASGNVITFEPWNNNDSLPMVPGSYYLTQDVTMSGGWVVPDGIFNLCLNGHTIRAESVAGVIQMRNAGKTVNLFDEAGNTGTIINTYSDTEKIAGGVHILQSELNMYGGRIINSKGRYAGGVYVEDGAFRMYGGEISGNSSKYVGGVYLQDSTFIMNGGTIMNNTGEIAGGILLTGTPVTISGSPIVKGNTANGNDSNVYLYDSSKITPAGPLSGTDSFGISMKKPAMFTKSGDIKASDYEDYFSSDSSDYSVTRVGRYGADLRLAKKKSNSSIEDSVPAAVTANNRIYDGTEPCLVTVNGEAVGGTMYYAVGMNAETPPETGWSTEIPVAPDLGTYYVWYFVAGDECHEDSEPNVVTVTISNNVYTASAEHRDRDWQKGSSESLTIVFKGKLGDEKTYGKWNKKVVIDSKEIPESAYSHKSGSLVIDLKPAYLETLSAGVHTLNVTFTDGAASAQFRITEKSSSVSEKTDTAVTCQKAGYPAGYAWNESAKACQPGYIDAGGNFHSCSKANRLPVPNTADR